MMRLFAHRATAETKTLNDQLSDTIRKVENVTAQLLNVADVFKTAVEEFKDDGQI